MEAILGAGVEVQTVMTGQKHCAQPAQLGMRDRWLVFWAEGAPAQQEAFVECCCTDKGHIHHRHLQVLLESLGLEQKVVVGVEWNALIVIEEQQKEAEAEVEQMA